ncbi:MAG: glutamine--tRNA ligase, partial [Flavobacteriales bacterium]
RRFAEMVGVARRENVIDYGMLEFCLREHLNRIATRVMVVLDPVKLIITNYPEGTTEQLTAENNPEDEGSGTRPLPFGRELWIERDDFKINPEKKYFRLAPGLMVRLKHAYIVRCDDYVTDENGNVTEIRCTYMPESRSGNDTSGINVKGTIHWVSAAHGIPCEVRLYDRLFRVENPSSEEGDFKEYINPESLKAIDNAFAEPFLKDASLDDKFQFIRKGYFCLDADSSTDRLVFNRTVQLKDTWTRQQAVGEM